MLNQRQRDAARDAASDLDGLRTLAGTDPENAHGQAEAILLRFIIEVGTVQTDEVVESYRALAEGARWWAFA